jgi:hypothetical protein
VEENHLNVKDGVREVVVGPVPCDQVPRHWAAVHEWLDAALAHSQQNELTMPELYKGLRNGTYVLCLVIERAEPDRDLPQRLVGAAVLMLSVDPLGFGYVGVMCLGGVEVETWLGEMVEFAKAVAREHQCDSVVAVGRIGWRWLLQAQGAKMVAGVFKLDVKAGD